MQLMMIKINGSELIEHNFDNNAAKIFLSSSTAAHPMHTTTAHNFHRLIYDVDIIT
jgi:hypothetical protein